MKGQVQKAFGAQDVPEFDKCLDHLAGNEVFQAEFGPLIAALGETEKKIAVVKTFKFLATQKVIQNPVGSQKKREGILNGYRDFAEKKGIAWRNDAKSFEDRGMDAWEAERQAQRARACARARTHERAHECTSTHRRGAARKH